ncbi:endoribonuclease L-PSP [Rhizodiscina lignyota]|uniref:Endoribonuclease L-PSP n=1 Tax=Rhizodiscina lignyota TaxID=1504668 RepID=A0A9P4IC61_9PEZI|nr:endoribonuclease L-PSP [Rhizodiscina lignyota]
MSGRQAVFADKAPKPNGNYSHVVRSGDKLFVCGFMGDDPVTGKIVEGGVEAQTRQAIENIKACVEAAGSSLDKVLSRRLYMTERAEFRTVDAIWASYMKEPYPVSTLIGVTWLAKEGAVIEIEVVAEA